jgi:hypothetical protein
MYRRRNMQTTPQSFLSTPTRPAFTMTFHKIISRTPLDYPHSLKHQSYNLTLIPKHQIANANQPSHTSLLSSKHHTIISTKQRKRNQVTFKTPNSLPQQAWEQLVVSSSLLLGNPRSSRQTRSHSHLSSRH